MLDRACAVLAARDTGLLVRTDVSDA